MPSLNPDRALYDSAPCGHLLVRADGVIARTNQLFAQWCRQPVQALEGRVRLRELLAPGSRLFHDTQYLPLLALQGSAHEVSFDLALGNSTLPVLINAQVQPAPDGGEALTSITVFNASATRRHERALVEARREAERAFDELADRNAELQAQTARLQVTLDSMADAVVAVDAAGRIELINRAAEGLLAKDAAQVVGQPFAAVVSLQWAYDAQPRACPVTECLATGETRRATRDSLLHMADGGWCRVRDTVAPIRDGQGLFTGAIWVCRDVSEQHHLAQRAVWATRHDQLTGLPNRQEFEQALARAATQRAQDGTVPLLCYIDLDQFKVINDTLSHAAGDALLREVAGLLRDGVRHSDTLARLGGDEFGVLLEGCSVENGLMRVQDLRLRIEAHRFHWQGMRHAVTASMGVVAVSPASETHPALAALAGADIACHAAKEAGRNRVQFLAAEDAQLHNRRGEMHWVTRLQRALAEDHFVLFFQPIVATGDPQGPVSHGEILLRLRGEDGALVSPALFIPAAERYQLMSALDRHVARKTLAWMQQTPAVHCALNVSGQSLGDAAFLDDVVALLRDSGVDPRRLCIEITETAAIGNLEAAQSFIARLRALGTRFALDDFGAGLSSFAYLRTLKADLLKIDGSFVRDMHLDAHNRVIVESIHRVARAFNMRTVAEWVENDAILGTLHDIGIDYAQGWRTGRPVPVEEWGAPAPARHP